jgi:hypothetical protein
MAHDVFICHSAKDKTTADAVCAMLESNGVRCWIAPRDVTPGMEWSECIIDAIEECRVMVLVFTTNANESGQIRREIERAVNRGVAILPIRIEDILPARALEYFIGNVHWLDALTPPLESHIQNLAGTVKLLLGRLPQHVPPGLNPTPNPHDKSAPAQPERPPAREPLPTERAPEIFPSPPPPVDPRPGRSSANKEKRAIGIVVIAAVVFLFSSVAVVGTLHDSMYARVDYETVLGLLFGATGIVASYGVITKKSWGRLLQLIFSAAGIVWLLTIAQDAFRDSKNVMPWLGGFGFSVFVIWYLFTPRVKQEFAEASLARQKHFASMDVPSGVPSHSRSGLFTQGAGPLPRAVLVIAILSFVEAAIWVFGSWQDFSRGRIRPIDVCAILLLAGGVLTGYGLFRLQGWARFLKLVLSAVDVVILISVAQEAFHEGGFGEVMWIAFVIYFVWSAWYLFTPQMRPAFLPKS